MLNLPCRAKIAEEKEKKADFRRTERKLPPPFKASFQERRPKGRIAQVLRSPPFEAEKAQTQGISSTSAGFEEDSGRERLKRHRVEMSGRVWIPEMWGQEELLKDWIDGAAFDAPLFPGDIVSARAAMVEEGRKANSARLRIENRC